MGDFSPNFHEKTSFSYKKLDEINDDFLSLACMRQVTKLALLKQDQSDNCTRHQKSVTFQSKKIRRKC